MSVIEGIPITQEAARPGQMLRQQESGDAAILVGLLATGACVLVRRAGVPPPGSELADRR
jgi:hypothetical protein